MRRIDNRSGDDRSRVATKVSLLCECYTKQCKLEDVVSLKVRSFWVKPPPCLEIDRLSLGPVPGLARFVERRLSLSKNSDLNLRHGTYYEMQLRPINGQSQGVFCTYAGQCSLIVRFKRLHRARSNLGLSVNEFHLDSLYLVFAEECRGHPDAIFSFLALWHNWKISWIRDHEQFPSVVASHETETNWKFWLTKRCYYCFSWSKSWVSCATSTSFIVSFATFCW